MERKKIALLVCAIIISFVGIAYIAVNSLAFFIYESRSCTWANIDNIEVRIQLDLPKTLNCTCSYSKETDSKLAIFTLDLETDDIISYAQKNDFIPFEGDRDFISNSDEFQSRASNLLQKTATHSNRASYKMMLDPNARKLYVSLQYLN